MEAQKRIVQTADGRRLCLSSKVRIGWVPKKGREGDLIAVAAGSQIPIVLRSRRDEEYEVVGGCYIHGIGRRAARWRWWSYVWLKGDRFQNLTSNGGAVIPAGLTTFCLMDNSSAIYCYVFYLHIKGLILKLSFRTLGSWIKKDEG